MAEIGHYAVHRKVWDNFLSPLNRKEKFTEFEAWEWLIKSAYYFCTKKLIQKKLVIIPRGYFETTIEQIAETWKWDRRTVEKFLQLLEKDLMIKRFKILPKSLKSCTLLKINNYNVMQAEQSDKCKLKCELKCKSYCKLQCTPYKKDKKDNNINNNILGEFKNVSLSNEDLEKIKTLYGLKFNEAIEKLSSYIKSSNKKYKDFYAVLNKHNWVYREVMKNTIVADFKPKQSYQKEDGYSL